MTDSDWGVDGTRSVAAYFDGARDPDRDDRGRPMLDDDLLLVFNGSSEQVTFTLPDVDGPRSWRREIDTFSGMTGGAAEAGGGAADPPGPLAAGDSIAVAPRSLILLSAERQSGQTPTGT